VLIYMIGFGIPISGVPILSTWSQYTLARLASWSCPRRSVVPPLMNDFIGLQKDTAFIGIIGVLDGFRRAQIYAGQNFNLSSFTGPALCFIVLTFLMTRFTDRLLKRDQERLRVGGR
jgi:ABC-type arginine transport system permease subunit